MSSEDRFAITGVVAQHFRSLGDIAVENIGEVLVLTGPNGSGKSNFVDVLRFLRDSLVHDIEHAITIRQGVEAIRQYSRTRPFDMKVKLLFRQEFQNTEFRDGTYELEIASQRAGNYKIKREVAQWHEEVLSLQPSGSDAQGNLQFDPNEMSVSIEPHYFNRDDSGRIESDIDDFAGNASKLRGQAPETQLALGRAAGFAGFGMPVADAISKFQFTSIFPNMLRLPSKPDIDKHLKESGENWASVLKSLRSGNPGREGYTNILAAMRAMWPTLQDVHVRSVGGYLVPQFLVKDTEDGTAHYFDPSQVSDGTLRVFGILLALYQRPHPPLLALEEPELTIHPGALAILADSLKEASRRTQLVVTSHSPTLVDLFDPASLRLVTMERGDTHISEISAAQIGAVKDRLTSIQELMIHDNLRPEVGQ